MISLSDIYNAALLGVAYCLA